MKIPKLALAALSLARAPSPVHGSQRASSTLVRGSNHEDPNLPDFFPVDMKKEDLDVYYQMKKKNQAFTPIEVDKDDWVQQCLPYLEDYFNPQTNSIERSNFYLIQEPSGLCADATSCAFEKCSTGNNHESLLCLMGGNGLSSKTYKDLESTCNLPPSALPETITFPKTAADVIAAIQYAKEKGVQISIKSTGHSYTGAHTKAGTLMLNMRDYAKYATGDDSVVECDRKNDAWSNDAGETGDACTLAIARGKTAYIRVGGGQPWSDVYNAVSASNAGGKVSKNYGVGGGGAGSVGAAGGWLAGGGLSTGYERTEGLGVDQILELELALPDGSHVRVFPTEWRSEKGYMYPQTTKVTALCNANVVADEAQWKWRQCDDLPVPPEDLWMALRGGGGGTYAVTLSVKYQLFEQHPLQVISFGPVGTQEMRQEHQGSEKLKDAYDAIASKFQEHESGDLEERVMRTIWLFFIDFLFAPEKLSVSRETSLSCGNPSLNQPAIFCWGKDSAYPEISAAWDQVVQKSTIKSDPELADELSKFGLIDGGSYGSYGELAKLWSKYTYQSKYDNIFPRGVVPDSPLPGAVPSKFFGMYCSCNMPLGLLQSDDEAERELVFRIASNGGLEHTTGGNVAIAGDGMNAVSPTERTSGQSSFNVQWAMNKYGEDFLSEYLAAVYKHAKEDGIQGFPGFAEYNHICPDASTPSKSDWTKHCNPEEGECFSIQETVWGEELYSKLQEVKSAVDPDNLFDCYPCVKPKEE